MIQNADRSFVIGGWSTSGLNGDKSQASQGSIDYWITKVTGAISISTASVIGPKCAGTSFSINFTAIGSFAAGNIFTAQLSDAFGSFASPTTIGTLNSTTSSALVVSLPSNLAASANYQIQVISSNPLAQDIYPCTAFQIDSPIAYYLDADNDTYGSGVATMSCTPIAGWVTNNNDCNDSDPLVNSLPSGNDGVHVLSLNCEGSTGNIFSCFPMSQATSYQWILSSGLSSAFINNITPDTSIAITIAIGASNDSIGVAGKNSCGLSDTLYAPIAILALPGAAGSISGTTLVSSCTNQLGIPYSISPVTNADNYVWTLPATALINGNADTNAIIVDYTAYGFSGTISVYATNVCGTGPSSNLAITYENIPSLELCYITVDTISQKGLLWWQKPSAAQSDSIVIMRKNKITGIFEKIATVKDTVPTSYLDNTSDPGSIAGESYQMAIKDTCGNVGSFSSVITHKTIYLYGLLGWSNYPKLYWTPYEGINDTTRYYRIMRDVTGNGPFIAIDSVAYNAVLNYTDTSASAPACLTCRYRIDMVYETNCSPTERILLSKNTSRSNIKNKTAMPFDSTLLFTRSFADYQLKFNLVPNPSTGNCSLVTSQHLSECSISIYNQLGEQLWNYQVAELPAQSKINIPASEFSRGTYVVKLKSKQAVAVQKLVRN
ncbi:MAG TPA: T9SS type A sorting domain-containing protein [Bacteroidia bacterium]|nr:T9SS type A sorting domain-containing protein [Bacteroidia bacterium]